MSTSLHIPMWKKCRRLRTKEKLITLVQFAREINYSPNTVRRMINRYNLKAYKVGGKWYLQHRDLATVKKLLRGISL